MVETIEKATIEEEYQTPLSLPTVRAHSKLLRSSKEPDPVRIND
jgi:hypothetical protein